MRRVELAIIKIKFYETLKYYNYNFFNAYHLLYLDKYKDYLTDNLVSLAKRILFTIIKILKRRKKVEEKYSEVTILKLISYKLFTYLFIYWYNFSLFTQILNNTSFLKILDEIFFNGHRYK